MMDVIKQWQDFEALRCEIGLPEMDEYFNEAYRSYVPDPASVRLLDRTFVRSHPDAFRFPDDLVEALFRADDRIQAHPALDFAARFLHWAIFVNKKPYADPYLNDFYPAAMGDDRAMFPMVVLCANAPAAYAQMVQRGLDIKDVAGNFASLSGFAQEYHDATGHWGLSGCGWNVICVTEYLNTVATLRFAPAVLGDRFTIYQNEGNGSFLCLASAGIPCRADGLCAPDEESAAFITEWSLEGDVLSAHEVTREGRVMPHPGHWRADALRRILGPGDEVLEYHIPTAPGYEPQNVRASFKKAVTYFGDHFPELNIRGFWCYSWLYCPQLPELLENKDGGILRVFHMVRKVPVESGVDCFYPFVLDVPFDTPVRDLPEDTSLQRAIKRARLAEKHLCAGGVMMSRRELDELEVEQDG